MIAPVVPGQSAGAMTWRNLEVQLAELAFLMPQHRGPILDALKVGHEIEWESDDRRFDGDARMLRLGRRR